MPQSTLPLLDEAIPLLRTERLGRNVRGYHAVDSTSTHATAWAREGAPEGSVVIAEKQRAGRGRHGRRWKASTGVNLTFSVILRPLLTGQHLSLVTIAAAVAIAEAIQSTISPVRPGIKWPNDILIDGRKCCGLLLEASFDGADAPSHLVLGVGLNVNQIDFPPDLTDRATSLRLVTGRLVPRAPLLADLLFQLETHYDAIRSGSAATVRAAYEERLVGRNQMLTLHIPSTGRRVRGRFEGITEDGALCLNTIDGIRTFHSGEVTTDLSSHL